MNGLFESLRNSKYCLPDKQNKNMVRKSAILYFENGIRFSFVFNNETENSVYFYVGSFEDFEFNRFIGKRCEELSAPELLLKYLPNLSDIILLNLNLFSKLNCFQYSHVVTLRLSGLMISDCGVLYE